MAILKCKICGGNLEIIEGMTVCECEYCGSKQTVPSVDNEKKITLFTRANRLRLACEFDKAAGVYESIVTEFNEEAEAYWGLVLCKFGIEYVDDPKTGKKIPTCHRSSFDSVLDDSDFEMVMEYSDIASREIYRKEAKAIEDLRVGIIEVSSKEDSYDIFICYKETDINGERTIDSVIAQDVYDVLTEKGYKVFFARISLEDKLGQEYEPYIFAALNSAKIMLAFGTDYEYYNAVWVKNEWSRFLSLIEKGQKKTLIPCYKNLDAYDMPPEFKRLQAQDMGKIGAIQDLVRGIGKIIGDKEQNITQGIQTSLTPGVLTVRGNLFLEDKDFTKAYEYFERSLDDNPADYKAYLGKVLASLHLKNIDELKKYERLVDLDRISDFKHALQFSGGADREELDAIYESLEKKTQIRYLMQVLKKRTKIKEKEELLEAQERERHRELEEERKRKAQQEAFDSALHKINAEISKEVAESADTIKSVAQSKKRPIVSAMNVKIQEAHINRKKLEDEKESLENQRNSLGFFKIKQKTALAQQINTLNAQIRTIPSETSIRSEYAPQINQIDQETSKEIQEAEDNIRAKYTMPQLEDFAVD